MRAIIQRVSKASVEVDSVVISQISKGLMVLVGIASDDTDTDLQYIANKMLSLRLFDDQSGSSMWKRSVKDIQGEVLCVSQFTLLAKTTKGNKPDFHLAMSSQQSEQMYGSLLSRLATLYYPDKIKDGRFGAMMNVSLTNDGPVTIIVDSRKPANTPQTDEATTASPVPES